ncbi:MAG: SHD1 domain-containing protein [Rubripirellula sp.]
MRRFWSFVIALSLSVVTLAQDETREWSDSTGRFKIVGRLIEVVDGSALIEDISGKTLKIQVARLSAADQEFLRGGANPFQMVEPAAGVETGDDPNVLNWSVPKQVRWGDADQFTSMAGVEWNVPEITPPVEMDLRRAPLRKRTTFHETLHPLQGNLVCKRAVVGLSVTFAVPKAMSRLTVVDLESGKAQHSDQVHANMRPLAIMDDGVNVLMVGDSDERQIKLETKGELQLWRLAGTSIVRSQSWIPYPDEKVAFGKISDGEVRSAQLLGEDRVATISDQGHFAVWDLLRREPIWHARLSQRNFAFDVSHDRKLLALFDDKTLMVLDPATAEILGSRALPPNTPAGWPHLKWSPDGKLLLLATMGHIKIMDVATGDWVFENDYSTSPIAPQGLAFPDPDFVLLGNRQLLHLPSKLMVCDYSGIESSWFRPGVCLVAVQDRSSTGVLMPLTFPHEHAREVLARAQSDPTQFLIHPGVEVAIDVAEIDEAYREAARENLAKSAEASGYRVVEDSPIKIMGSLSGPTKERVRYITGGSYLVNKYVSETRLVWSKQDLWKRTGSNIPEMMFFRGQQTIQETLEEAGKQPDLDNFSSLSFPKFMSEPKPGSSLPASFAPTSITSCQVTTQGFAADQ